MVTKTKQNVGEQKSKVAQHYVKRKSHDLDEEKRLNITFIEA